MVGGLWAQYQNALAVSAGVKLPAGSPQQTEQSLNSPSMENPDETSSSGQKDDDDVSEDDSEDRIDQNAHDPERLKAFNVSNEFFFRIAMEFSTRNTYITFCALLFHKDVCSIVRRRKSG